LAPFIARKKADNEINYWHALQKIFKAYALLGWLVCIPTLVFARFAVEFLYGPQYQQGAVVLSIYVFTNLFINMGVAQGLWLLNERLAIISLAKTVVGALVAIVGNWFLLPHFGIIGVAIVAVSAQLTSAVLMNLIFSRRLFLMQIRCLMWPF
jgi:PST family polysaccharide transporter